MLPDISKRRMLNRFARNDYDSKMLKNVLRDYYSAGLNDGCTTPNAKDIVMRLNEYHLHSRETIFYAFAGISFYKSIHSGAYDSSEIPFLKAYSTPDIKAYALRSERQLWTIARSLAAQRRLARLTKDMVKVNRINKDWENLLNDFLDHINERLNYVNQIVIPEHIKFTPIYLLQKELHAEGISTEEYVDSVRGLEKNEFDHDTIRKQIEEFIAENTDDDQLVIWQEEMMTYVRALVNRDEINSRAAKEREEEERGRIKERVQSDVESMCGAASKLFKNTRRGGNKRHKYNYTLYAVVGARISRSKTRTSAGYFHRAGGQFVLTKDFDKATIFTSEKDAEECLSAVRQNPDIVAEIAYISNANAEYVYAS